MIEDTSALLRQIALGEDSVLELKRVTFSGDKITGPHRNGMADELASMANTHTGVVLLGVDDKTGTVIGLPEDKLEIVETWLRSICNDLIEPPLDCVIRKVLIKGEAGSEKVIMRMDVPGSLFVHLSPGGYFRRIGSSRRRMKPDFPARLFQQRSQARLIRFDEQIVPNAQIEDLNPQLWNRFRTVLSPKSNSEFLEKNETYCRRR